MKNKNDTANLRDEGVRNVEHSILKRYECYALVSEPPIEETEEFQGIDEIQEIAEIQEIEEIELEYIPEDDSEDDSEDEEIRCCSNCGEVIENDDYYSVGRGYDSQIFCHDCFDDKCFRCADCGQNCLYEEDHIEYCGSIICNSCSSSYYYCDGCGRYIHYEDYNSDRDRCYDCLEKNNTGVEGYHQNSDWEYIGECKPAWKGLWRGLGVELEIDCDYRDTDTEKQTVRQIRNVCNNLKFEYDGSLDNGFEIIMQPHTVEEFYAINWPAILEICRDNGYVSHSANHCGLHIHFSRAMFGATEKKQANAISKLIKFFESFWDDIIRVSRRTEQQADDYAKKYGVADINEVKRLAKTKNAGRYYAINNANHDTVEIRIMRGTLNLKSFLACIDFCINVVKNCRIITWKNIGDTAKWLKGIKPETREYIRSQNAFEEAAKCA